VSRRSISKLLSETARPVLGALLLASVYSNVAAQAPQQNPWSFRVDAGGLHQTETDLENSGGSVQADRWFASVGVDYAWNYRNSIGVSAGGGRSNFEFSDDSVFGGGAPWNSIDDARLSLSGRFGIGETGSLFLIPSIRYNGESGASSGDSRTYALITAAAWRIDENLTIGPGIGVISKLEDGTRIFPILAIDWNISERWNLSTGRGLAASQGPGLTLSYTLNSAWSFGLSGRYEKVEFRLYDEEVAPGGVGQDESFPLVLSAVLEPGPVLRASVFAGLEFGGRLKLKNSLGETLDEQDYDPAPIFGATLGLRF
jgi:hypothetical protein